MTFRFASGAQPWRRVLPGLLWLLPAAARAEGVGCPAVPAQEIVEAMRGRRGYNLTATANGARLQAETILALVRSAQARGLEAASLCIGPEAWFAAYLEVAGLSAERAPSFARLAREFGQGAVVRYGRDAVLGAQRLTTAPRLAAEVVISWPSAPGRADHYSFEDLSANPHLRITNKQLIRYLLLDFGERVVYADIEGLQGRPTSGALGLLFDLIGEAPIVESRMVIAPDGLQLSRTEGRKAFMKVTTTVTVAPDGRLQKGLPPDRPDLLALEERLKLPWRVSK